MDISQAAFEIELYGYTVLHGVLSQGEVAALREVGAALERAIGTPHRFGGEARHIANLVPSSERYLPLVDHARVLPVVEAALGTHIILASLNSRIVRPGDSRQQLHSDVPCCLRRPGPPIMVNTVWMLDDFSGELGATHVVPGSHRMAESSPPSGRALPNLVQAIAPAGSVLVFDGRAWHGGGENRGSHDRHALFGHYRVADWTMFQCDPHKGFPPDRLAALNDRQRQLLRMTDGIRGPAWVEDW